LRALRARSYCVPSQLNSGVSRTNGILGVIRWSGGKVLLVGAAYALVYVAVSVMIFTARAAAARRAHGGGNFLYSTVIPGWWFALLVLPPLVLAAWWLWARGRV
jgi:hypothetical protein